MKAIAIFLSLLFAASCFAAHVAFDLNDFSITGAIAKRKVEMFPDSRSFPRTNGNLVITADYYTFQTSAQGTYTRSNVTAGIYRCVVHGPNTKTTVYITVPVTTNTVDASAIFGVNVGSLMYDDGFGSGGLIIPNP